MSSLMVSPNLGTGAISSRRARLGPKPLADSKAAASVAVLHAGLRQPRQGAALLSQEQDFVVCATAPHSGVEGAQIVREHSGRVFARYGAQKLKFAMVKLCLTFPVVSLKFGWSALEYARCWERAPSKDHDSSETELGLPTSSR